jgi:hypothetical protein
MFRLILMLLIGFATLALPSSAQDSARVEKLLNGATAAFKQNNYFLGVGQVQQACGMLRANPSASPNDNYIDIAAGCFDGVSKGIHNAQAQGDTMAVTQRIGALQPLLQSLMEWDRNNPRWHYEKGMLLREQSLAFKDKNVGIVQQAISEFQKSLAMSGGGAYSGECQKQIEMCQQVVAQGRVAAKAWDRAHPPQYSANPTPTPNHFTQFCPLCGHVHAPGACWPGSH